MELTRKIEFKKVRDFGEIINVTFEFIRQNFKGLGLPLLFIAGPAAILLGIAQGFNSVNTVAGDFETIMFGFAFTLPLMALLWVLVLGITYGYINLYLNSEKNSFSVEEVWGEVKRNFGMMLVTVIVSGLLTIIATFMLIIPGIYFGVLFNIIYMVRIREKRTISDSISRCMDLISGHWWFTFGLMIVVSIITYIFSLVLTLPAAVLQIFSSLGLEPQDRILSNLITVIASILSSFAYMFYGILNIAMAFHYYSIVEKKEAVGLMERLDNISEIK